MDDVFVAQLMTADPRTVSPTTSLDEAAELMINDAIGSVMVVDDDGRLQGVLTRTDFVRLVADHESGTDPVETYMTTDVVTTAPQTPIGKAANTMIVHGFHHLPVVDDDKTVIGVITTTDLAGYLAELETPLA